MPRLADWTKADDHDPHGLDKAFSRGIAASGFASPTLDQQDMKEVKRSQFGDAVINNM